jgi:hypothetical protein
VKLFWKSFPATKPRGDEAVALRDAVGTLQILDRMTTPSEGVLRGANAHGLQSEGLSPQSVDGLRGGRASLDERRARGCAA